MSKKKKSKDQPEWRRHNDYAVTAFKDLAELVDERELVNGLEIDMCADSVRVPRGAYMSHEPTGVHHYTLKFSINVNRAPDGTWIENDED